MRASGLTRAGKRAISQIECLFEKAREKRLSGRMDIRVDLKDGGPARTEVHLPSGEVN
jgi:hypothetical protein